MQKPDKILITENLNLNQSRIHKRGGSLPIHPFRLGFEIWLTTATASSGVCYFFKLCSLISRMTLQPLSIRSGSSRLQISFDLLTLVKLTKATVAQQGSSN